jgi:protein-tyrosine phosphatase
MAEALLRHRLEQVDPSVAVSSAGLHPGGRPATAHGVATMAARGLDIAAHRSRELTPELLRGADLVIGMAREHVREVAVVEPGAVDRTFTLKELVAAAEANGGRPPGESISAWLDRVGRGRRRDDLLGVGYDNAFDIDDPVGRPRADYEATADELDGLLGRLVALAWPTPDRQHDEERSA